MSVSNNLICASRSPILTSHRISQYLQGICKDETLKGPEEGHGGRAGFRLVGALGSTKCGGPLPKSFH